MFRTFRDIQKGTPVDEGATRNNWYMTESSPSNKTTTSNGGNTLKSPPLRVLGQRVFYTNNKPNINTLEYGGYPSPVKKGSWVKGKGWVKKSKGGYSKRLYPMLTPKGWVRALVLRAKQEIKKI